MKRLFRRLMRANARECEKTRELMSDFVDDELSPADRQKVEEHVGLCPPCRTVLANLRQTLERLGLLAGTTPPEAEDADAVAERIRESWRSQA